MVLTINSIDFIDKQLFMLPESQFSLLNFSTDGNIKLITIKIFLIKLSARVHVFSSAMKGLEGLLHT